MKEKKITKVPTLKSKIKKVLTDQGDYDISMDFMIEITAGNLYAYFLIMKEVEELKKACVIEKTRELNDKKQADPLLRALREQTDEVRKCLRELRLTLSTMAGASDDEMNDLIDDVNSVE